MVEFVTLNASVLTGWDFLVVGLIVLFTEYVIKTLTKELSDRAKEIVFKLSPIVIGAITYTVLAVIQKATWETGLIHGLYVGLTAMGSYDLVLDTIKKQGKKSIEDLNEAIKKAVEEHN